MGLPDRRSAHAVNSVDWRYRYLAGSAQMERCGLQRDTVYLVRPDGYLAVVAAPDQTEALTSYFDKHEFHLADVKAGDRVRIS